MKFFNEVLVTFYLYMYILLTDFTAESEWLQDLVGIIMLVIIFLSISVNTLYMLINTAIITRKNIIRWWRAKLASFRKKN
jgi:hypothetical protein